MEAIKEDMIRVDMIKVVEVQEDSKSGQFLIMNLLQMEISDFTLEILLTLLILLILMVGGLVKSMELKELSLPIMLKTSRHLHVCFLIDIC
jgi:hypothetical protein